MNEENFHCCLKKSREVKIIQFYTEVILPIFFLLVFFLALGKKLWDLLDPQTSSTSEETGCHYCCSQKHQNKSLQQFSVIGGFVISKLNMSVVGFSFSLCYVKGALTDGKEGKSVSLPHCRSPPSMLAFVELFFFANVKFLEYTKCHV